MEQKSVNEISNRIISKVSMLLLELMPAPSCPLKRQQNEWRKAEVIKDVKKKLDEKYHINQTN